MTAIDAEETAEEPPAFRVDLRCRNCGDEFDGEFGRGTRVIESNGRSQSVGECHEGVTVVGPTTEFGDNRLSCPTCDLTKPVRVDNREPITGDNE